MVRADPSSAAGVCAIVDGVANLSDGGDTVFDRIAATLIALTMAVNISGCGTSRAGPTIPKAGEVSVVGVGGPYFVESRDGNPFSCSTWAGIKLWLDSDEFTSAVSQTLEDRKSVV